MGFLKLLLIFKSNLPTERALHEKPYFPSPGTSWKAQKDQVNTTFASYFLAKKDRSSHLRKDQNKNFSVITKHHLSINFLAQKGPYFHLQKVFKTKTFQ